MHRSTGYALLIALVAFFIGVSQAKAACWECKDFNSVPHCVVTTTTGHATCTVSSTNVGGIVINECSESGADCVADPGNTGDGGHGGVPPIDGCEVNLEPQAPQPTSTPHGAPVPWMPRQLSVEESATDSEPSTADTSA